MMIVLRSTETLPLLSAAEITDQPCVEIGDASSGMPERVLAEIAPEVEVDPLKVVRWVVRNEHDRHPRRQPFPELTERVLRGIGAVKRFDPAIPERVHINRTKLCHVADGGRSDAEGCFAVNDNQGSHHSSDNPRACSE